MYAGFKKEAPIIHYPNEGQTEAFEQQVASIPHLFKEVNFESRENRLSRTEASIIHVFYSQFNN